MYHMYPRNYMYPRNLFSFSPQPVRSRGFNGSKNDPGITPEGPCMVNSTTAAVRPALIRLEIVLNYVVVCTLNRHIVWPSGIQSENSCNSNHLLAIL